MDISVSSTSAVSQGFSSPGRSDAGQYREAVRTELPVTQAVAATGDSSAQHGVTLTTDDTESKAKLLKLSDQIRENLQSRYDKDMDSGELVYRSIDMTNGQVLYQYPDERAMRLRTLLKDMESKQKLTDPSADPKAGNLFERSA
jgi:uncharacterized FlaG/YvyC family protein